MSNTKFKQTDIGLIPEDWELKMVRDLTIKITKGTTPTTIGGKFTEYGINFIKVESISENGIINRNKFMYIDENTNELLARSKLQKNDILYSIAGTIGRVSIVQEDILPANTNQAIAILRPNCNKIDLNYLKYALINPENQNYLLSKVVQGVQANLSLADIGNSFIPVPELKEQKAIAKILSDLDSKIELNQHMNKTLEKIGKTLFKRWFVDFEFPNEQGKPYKSSGGEMVYNEELKKEIPNGSQIIRLKDQLIFERGIEPGSAIYENSKTENNIRFIRVSDLNNDNSTTFIPLELATSKVIESDVLLSLDASVGIVRIGYNGSFSSGIRKIYDNCNKLSNALIYFLLKSEDIQNTINQYANGTTILHAGKSIEFMNFVIPNEKMLDKFKTQITPIFNQILYNIKENKQLADTRDLLLPKLMSGKIRVKY